jgi:sugar/nucleoside kinase (ribokinase family)
LLREFCPSSTARRRKIFFDLADPEKRTGKDLTRALELIASFVKYFEVSLGVNEKEACEVGQVLGLSTKNRSRDGLAALAREIQARVPVSNLVVHPVAYAFVVHEGTLASVDGPYVEKPLITTGAGDHFNSGFCLGRLLGFDHAASALLGVTTSGFYVRRGQSPSIGDLVEMLREWPAED